MLMPLVCLRLPFPPFPVLSQLSLEVEMLVLLMSVREALSRQSSAEPWLAGYCD